MAPMHHAFSYRRDFAHALLSVYNLPMSIVFSVLTLRLSGPSQRGISLSPYLFLFNFYCYSVTVVCIFSPSLHPTPAEPTSLPCLHPPPRFCPCVLYSSSCKPLSPLSPPHSPLALVRKFHAPIIMFLYNLLFFLYNFELFVFLFSESKVVSQGAD